MELSRRKSISDYIRTLILYGFVYDVDYSYLRQYNETLGKISGSLNQIAKRINSTGNVYEEDMKEVKGIMDEVWRTQKAMLRKQPLIMEAKQAELCEEQLACGMDENVEVNAESDNKIEGVPDISEDENVIDNTENTKKDTPYSEALETEKKVLKEMIELEKKHFGELKKTVKIDVSL